MGEAKGPSVRHGRGGAGATVAQPGDRSPAGFFFLGLGWGHQCGYVRLGRPLKVGEQHLRSLVPPLSLWTRQRFKWNRRQRAHVLPSQRWQGWRVQARLVVLSVKLNAERTRWIDHIQTIAWSEELALSVANANVVRTACSVLRGLHNPSKQTKTPLFLNALNFFLPKGSGKKSRKNGVLISCCCGNQAPNKPYHLILLWRGWTTPRKMYPDIHL